MRHLSLLTVGVLALAAAAPATRPTIPVTADAMRIWPGRAPRATGDADAPTLTAYPPTAPANGTAVVICPGGGYTHLSPVKEGSTIAQWLAGHGVFAFVLKYRVNVSQPAPLLDGQRAVRFVRYHAAAWGVDRTRIGIMGFSAGGHVASSVGTHYDTGIPKTGDPVQDESCRPDFMLLVYPVITMKPAFAHMGSRRILLGDHPPMELETLYSNETQVTADTPPAFLAASKTDKVVPVKNAQSFADALKRRKVPVEFLKLPSGNHGYGMAPGDPVLSTWTDKCLDWMKGRGLLTAEPAKAK